MSIGTVYRGADGSLLAWDRVLTDPEVRMLRTNPYQLFKEDEYTPHEDD